MSKKVRYSQKFETTILRAACSLGLLRMLIAIYRDLTIAYDTVDFTIDTVLLVVFLIPLLLTFSKVNINYYVIPFCFVVAASMPFSWISSGGLDSNNEYQIIGAIFLFGMVLNGTWLYFFMSLMVITEIVLIYLWNNHIALISGLLKEPSMGSIHFALMAVATTIVVVYMKHMLRSKREILEDQREVLSLKLQELTNKTSTIRKQKSELEAINKKLESQVNLRSAELKKQNTALKKYMDVSLKEINAPLDSILNSVAEITNLDKNHEVVRLLADSGIELQQSVKHVAEQLEDDVLKLNHKNK